MSPASVLFCCDFNSARSAMAHGIIREWYQGSMIVDSAGLSCDEPVNGYAIAVMREIQIDIQNHEPKLCETLTDTPFDVVISLTESANLAVQHLPWSAQAAVEHWDVPNPVNADLPREAQLEEFRKTRDILIKLILARFALPQQAGDPDYQRSFFNS